MTAWAYTALAIGAGLIAYGLSPLSGTTIGGGVSERGCLAALAGIAIVCSVGVLKVTG